MTIYPQTASMPYLTHSTMAPTFCGAREESLS